MLNNNKAQYQLKSRIKQILYNIKIVSACLLMNKFNSDSNIMRKIRQLSLDNLDPPTNSSITIKQSRHYQMRPKSRGWDIPKLLKPYSVEVVKPRVTNMQKDFLKRSQTIEQENKLLIRSISASMSIDDMLRGYTPDVKLTQKEIQAAKAIIDKKQVKQWIK